MSAPAWNPYSCSPCQSVTLAVLINQTSITLPKPHRKTANSLSCTLSLNKNSLAKSNCGAVNVDINGTNYLLERRLTFTNEGVAATSYPAPDVCTLSLNENSLAKSNCGAVNVDTNSTNYLLERQLTFTNEGVAATSYPAPDVCTLSLNENSLAKSNCGAVNVDTNGTNYLLECQLTFTNEGLVVTSYPAPGVCRLRFPSSYLLCHVAPCWCCVVVVAVSF